MKNTVKHLIVKTIHFAICLLFVAQVNAQTTDTKATAEERAQKMTEQMQKRLSLTAAQIQPVQALNLKYAKQNEQTINSNDNKYSKLKKIKSTQNEKSKELKLILTETQFKEYEKWVEEKKSELKENYKKKQSN